LIEESNPGQPGVYLNLPEMSDSQQSKNLKHNFTVNLLDGGLFGFGLGFASFTTMIPLFVATLTSSATLIGLVPAIHNVGWQLPQLLMAKRIARMERVKPYVTFMTVQERLPILGLGIVGLLVPRIGVRVALILTFILLIWQGLGAGLTANAWQIMVSKIIPSNILATFFGAQSAAANLLASLGAYLAGTLLVVLNPPYDFSTCFFIASLLLVSSWVFLNLTREEKREMPSGGCVPQPLWHDIRSILKRDRSFTHFLISRFIAHFGMMAFAFYSVYAVKILRMTTVQVGVMTSILMVTMMVMNPLLGRLSDRWSRKWVLVIGSVCAAVSALLAVLIKEVNLFALVFLLNGAANTAFWTIGITMSLEFGEEAEKPTYVGMANTLVAPAAIIAPLIGGLLADAFDYVTAFITSAVMAFIASGILILLVNDPKKPEPYEQPAGFTQG